MERIAASKIAVGNYHYIAYSFDYFLDSMQRLGMGNIELWGAAPHFCVEDQNEASMAELNRRIKGRGLSVVCFCPEQNTYPVDLSCREASIRLRSIAHMKKAIELCAMMDCPRMLVCPGNGYMDEPEEDAWWRCSESLRELAETAASFRVTLLLETQSREESLFLNSCRQLRRMVGEVGHDRLKGMLDTVQMAQFDNGVGEVMNLLGDDIRHVHMGNTVALDRPLADGFVPQEYVKGRQVCGHIGFREGNLPIGRYMRELADSGYAGYVTIEICQRAYFLQAERYAREAVEIVSQFTDKTR